jgi:hypothetical protein
LGKGGILEPRGAREGRGLKKRRAPEAREKTRREKSGPKHITKYARIVRINIQMI